MSETMQKNDQFDNLVVLSYDFFFEVPKTWTNGFAFESDLGKFFEAMNLEASVIRTMDGMSQGRRMIYIKEKPKPVNSPTTPENLGQGRAPAVQLKQMTNDYKKK